MREQTHIHSKETPYDNLSPELVMAMVEEATGQTASGALFAMNSYENRVYDVGMDDGPNIIIKAYRPGRWSGDQILEEHQFALELQAVEIPVVPPTMIEGQTLFEKDGYFYALYPKRGGQAVELRTDEDFRMIGRLVARIHNIGSNGRFELRPTMSVKTFGWNNLVYLRENNCIPPDLMTAYDATCTQVLRTIEGIWGQDRDFQTRIHGDCHLGNILRDDEMFLVDLDDCLTGPEVQDLWPLVSGERAEVTQQLGLLLEGYTQLREFDFTQLQLVECLRSLRMIHYTAWLARRWHDPTFPKNFPFFEGQGYWERHINALKEQIAAMDEPLLVQV